MLPKLLIIGIASVELAIGITTLAGVAFYGLLGLSTKSASVALFVISSNLVSIALGAGLLNYRSWARVFLLFFSGYVILTKLFIFAGLIKLNGEIFLLLPGNLKDIISVLYHTFILISLNQRRTKTLFSK